MDDSADGAEIAFSLGHPLTFSLISSFWGKITLGTYCILFTGINYSRNKGLGRVCKIDINLAVVGRFTENQF